jgi:nucleoside-diphosphate-sugar epimerase
MTLLAILGCAGSVGTRVVLRALQNGYKVLGIDIAPSFPTTEELSHITSNPDFTYASLDVRDYEALLEPLRGCDAIILLAATFRNPGDYAVQTHNGYVVTLFLLPRQSCFSSCRCPKVVQTIN